MNINIRLSILCSKYGEERFLNWCHSLEIFRFCQAHPYPDDFASDRFIAVLKFTNKEQLKKILKSLKVNFEEVDLDIYLEQEETKVIYGKAEIKQSKCFVTINEVIGIIEIEVYGVEEDPYALTNETFHSAKNIDEFLKEFDYEFCSSPFDDNYCITPEFYPVVWE